MPVIHIVMFRFKSDLPYAEVEKACGKMLDLKGCVHPQTKKPYLKVTGGRNNSPEGMAKGLTHGFVVEFENTTDRDYYVKEDPLHMDFIKYVGDIVEDVTVFDYTPDIFS